MKRGRGGNLAEFPEPLDLPPLDGIVTANSHHFHRKQASIIEALRGLLNPGGRLFLVEHNTDRGDAWVPFPISFESWAMLAGRCGFEPTRETGARPSRFVGEIYAVENISPIGASTESTGDLLLSLSMPESLRPPPSGSWGGAVSRTTSVQTGRVRYAGVEAPAFGSGGSLNRIVVSPRS